MNTSITGQVSGAGKGHLSDIVVKAVHEPTGSTFAKKTDSNGVFLFDRMKAGGPYIISIAISGFQPVEISGVFLKTTESLTQDIELIPAQG